MKKLSVFVIEDNRILRESLKSLIQKQPDLRIVGTFGGGRDTLERVRTARPDVVIMDMGLRSSGGPALVSALARELPRSRVIGMGLLPSQEDIVEFVEAGAAGFILKEATTDVILRSVRSVAKGSSILPPPLTDTLFSHIMEHTFLRSERKRSSAVRMTKREREITVLIAEGMSNKEIARNLNLSPYTVKSHVHNILEKMALHSRLQIVASILKDE